MNRRLLILIAFYFLFTNINVNAQIKFGINSALSIANLSNEKLENYWDTGIGYRVGGFVEKSFGKVGIRFETDYSYTVYQNGLDDKLGLHYISVPITLFYNPIKRFKIFIGPELNFLLAQKGPKYKLSFGEETFDKIDYGIHAEIEFLALNQLGISIRNYFGLQYNFKLEYLDINTNQMNQSGMDKFNIFGVGLNYYFSKD